MFKTRKPYSSHNLESAIGHFFHRKSAYYLIAQLIVVSSSASHCDPTEGALNMGDRKWMDGLPSNP